MSSCRATNAKLRAREFISTINGFAEVYDWTWTDAVEPRMLAKIAEEERAWIAGCDVFLLLAPQCPSGALVEFGIAVGAGVRRIGVVNPERGTIFAHLPGVALFDSDQAARAWLLSVEAGLA